MSQRSWTRRQGEYLAFILGYTIMNGIPPHYTDIQDYFHVSQSAVHQMIGRLEEKGFLVREPGVARSMHVLTTTEALAPLPTPSRTPSAKIYQMRVALAHADPPIWRRILVPGDYSLAALHLVIQMAMGWLNYHLHEFTIDGVRYGQPNPAYDDMLPMEDHALARIDDVADEGDTFTYVYDFGDDWVHAVTVERILEPRPDQPYPACTDGRNACPPEDVGSFPGYAAFLEALADPNHEDHEMYSRWIGGTFDPEAFDVAAADQRVGYVRWGVEALWR